MTITILAIATVAILVLMLIVAKASHNSLGGQWVVFALGVSMWVMLGYAYCHEDDMHKKEAPQKCRTTKTSPTATRPLGQN